MKLVQEFKTFALRGNVLDLAVGVIIGLAFGQIVNSLVNDILTPFLGALLQGVNFSSLQLTLFNDAVIKYGSFIQAVLDFLIIAIVIFILVKIANRAFPKKPKAHELSVDQKLLTEIRDELRKKNP
jgi:large conductance mechanosensitive channel